MFHQCCPLFASPDTLGVYLRSVLVHQNLQAEVISKFKNDSNDMNKSLWIVSKAFSFCSPFPFPFLCVINEQIFRPNFFAYLFMPIEINLLHSWISTEFQNFWIPGWLHFWDDCLKFHFHIFYELSEKYKTQLYFNHFPFSCLISLLKYFVKPKLCISFATFLDKISPLRAESLLICMLIYIFV